MEDPDQAPNHLDIFVDRVPESVAMHDSLVQHRQRMDTDGVESQTLRNALVFYGEGGVGKSELSSNLESWIRKEPVTSHHWGPSPATHIDAIVRWDFHGSNGTVAPVTLLAAVRQQLEGVTDSWMAFDLAFRNYYEARLPGQPLYIRSPSEKTTTFEDVATGLLSDGFTAADFVLAGGGAGAVVTSARLSINAFKQLAFRKARKGVLRDYDGLSNLIERAAVIGSPREESKIAGQLAFQITRKIDQMPPTERPLVVVFVDALEHLQQKGRNGRAEALINRLVARLPYFLFVVTGRNSLAWHDGHQAELAMSGAGAWPLLSRDDGVHEEPRQHAIGNLSTTDAETYLRLSFEHVGVRVEVGLIEKLARATDGWPVHMDALLAAAAERGRDGRELTAQDLTGNFTAIVDQLLEDLPRPVSDAFRAACLLPYFDAAFAAAAAQVKQGDVEHLLRRSLHRANDNSTYKYRIHDELRAVVRKTGSEAKGGWSEQDWIRHAHLAQREAERRFEAALRDRDDMGAIHALALGLNVATANGIWDAWLVNAVRRSPTIRGLAALISEQAPDDAPQELVDMLTFLNCRAEALASAEVPAALLDVAARRNSVSDSAALWIAYDLRNRGLTDPALAYLDDLLTFGPRTSLYRMQITTTLRIARRYQDALSSMADLTERQCAVQHASIKRSHGHVDGLSDLMLSRIDRASSRRFQVELSGTWVTAAQYETGITEPQIQAVYQAALLVGDSSTQAICLTELAALRMFDDELFEKTINEIQALAVQRFQPYSGLARSLALKAWVTGRDDLARRAYDVVASAPNRSSSWIPTEILLEASDRPAPSVPTQWLEPYDNLRDRWLDVFSAVVARIKP